MFPLATQRNIIKTTILKNPEDIGMKTKTDPDELKRQEALNERVMQRVRQQLHAEGLTDAQIDELERLFG